MLEMGMSGLMSGDEKRDDALPSAPALVLDSTMYRSCWVQNIEVKFYSPI